MTDPSEAKINHSFNWRDALNIVTSAVLLVAGIAVLMKTFASPSSQARVEPKVPTREQSIKGLPSKGNVNAPVALIVYSDFECPFCRKFATDILPTLEDKFVSKGQLVILFRHYPLERIHPLARAAADAAACASRQGRFWEMHDQLFKPGASIDAAGLRSAAIQARVREDDWQECIAARPAEVANDVAAGQELEIRGTPFFVMGIPTATGVIPKKAWSGSGSAEAFSKVIEESIRGSKK